jgi:hypothetical protein
MDVPMELKERLDYPAGPAAVFAMITDKAFREDVCKATGARSWSVEVDSSGGGAGAGVSVTVRRVMPAHVSDLVKKLVGETIEVVQTEQWEPGDGVVRRAEVLVEVVGQPAKMIGIATIEPGVAGAVMAVEGDVKVKIPLLGGKLEKEIAGGIRSALAVEHKRGMAYLSSPGPGT